MYFACSCLAADDIIRQHKTACLRITCLLACKDLLWIGTSAGVILTLPIEKVCQSTTKNDLQIPSVTGVKLLKFDRSILLYYYTMPSNLLCIWPQYNLLAQKSKYMYITNANANHISWCERVQKQKRLHNMISCILLN